jgi:adenylate cyclase
VPDWFDRTRRAAVRMDSNERLLTLAHTLRRRLPGDDRFGDPLSTAGDEPVHVIGRGIAALQPDRPSLVHQVGLGSLQLWQSMSEAMGRGRGDRPVAIQFTDLAGFSRWALSAGDEAVLELLRAVDGVLERSALAHRGRIVKRLGDGAMAVFDDVRGAVDAALEAIDAAAEIEVAGYPASLRAGVHHGRPRRLGGDYLGVDVNLAARVAAAAKGGQLVVSEETFAQLDAAAYKPHRPKTLRAKGAPKGFRVRRVERAG